MSLLKDKNEGSIFGEVISVYTQDQAIEDGVLVLVGYVGRKRVIFTQNLLAEGYEDQKKRRDLIEEGLELLRMVDPEDSPHMKLRVIKANKIWVIWNRAGGFTFLAPEDY